MDGFALALIKCPLMALMGNNLAGEYNILSALPSSPYPIP